MITLDEVRKAHEQFKVTDLAIKELAENLQQELSKQVSWFRKGCIELDYYSEYVIYNINNDEYQMVPFSWLWDYSLINELEIEY